MTRYAFVLGNGPSLKGFDFRRLSGFDTLGMNAAYRHWDQIGWYPTYYCCLDDQMVETHHAEIDRIYSERRIREVFVHGRFFELHPDRIGNPHFYSLDQVTPYWFKRRGSEMGFTPLHDHPAFRTTDTTKITTGAYAVRFMAYKGYERIALMGIDLKYVEVLPEARPTQGVGLVIEETPDENPNYFFDDYQRAGDRYNIPNPDVHQGDLHPRSFEVLRTDFEAFGVTSRVVNTNPESIIEKRKIFPLASLDDVLSEEQPAAPAGLSSVVVPTNTNEIDQILANFRVWSSPYCRPTDGGTRPVLCFVFNNPEAEQHRPAIEAAYAQARMDRFFSALVFRTLGLTGKDDQYVRVVGSKPVGVEGYKSGPNNQFFLTLGLAAEFGRYTFLMETDCTPIRAGWLDRLNAIVSGPESFYILGSVYRGKATISTQHNRHINGNAVYAVGDPAFQRFVSDFWQPRLREIIATDERRIAYDCALEFLFTRMQSNLAGDAVWPVFQSVAHKLRYSDFIQNISAKADTDNPDEWLVRRVLDQHPETFVIHSGPVAKAAAHAPESDPREWRLTSQSLSSAVPVVPADGVYPIVAVIPMGRARKAGEDFILPAGSGENYVLCLMAGAVKAGDVLQGTLSFTTRSRANIALSLNRHGATKFEGTRSVAALEAGEHSLTISHRFAHDHDAPRLQIGVDAETAVRIDGYSMTRVTPPPLRSDACRP